MLDAWIVNIWWLVGTALIMLESFSKRLLSLQSPTVESGKHHWLPMCEMQTCKIVPITASQNHIYIGSYTCHSIVGHMYVV